MVISDSLSLSDLLLADINGSLPIYGTLEGGTVYWGNQLNGQEWDLASAQLRYKAMVTATIMIDDLGFSGTKTVVNQPLQFPRNGATETPIPIQQAAYELALELLKGIMTQAEYENTFSQAMYFGKIRMDYAYGSKSPEYLTAGIPSQRAWIKVKPYLADNRSINLRRV